jgi:MerR family copper efflux transcriptional regulator
LTRLILWVYPVTEAMDDQGLTIAEAAKAFGVSTKTIRRHIKDGKIPYVLVQGKYGEEYRIFGLSQEQLKAVKSDDATASEETIEAEKSEAADSTAQDKSPPEMAPKMALDIITELQKTNLQLAGQLGAAQERIRELESQIRLLNAPKESGLWGLFKKFRNWAKV